MNHITVMTGFFPMLKHFYRDGSANFYVGNATIHRVHGLTEWFDEDEAR